MKSSRSTKETIIAPRTFSIFLIQLFAFILAGPLIILSPALILRLFSISSITDIIAYVIISLFILSGTLLYYHSQRHRIRLTFDKQRRLLKLTKRSQLIASHDLNNIKSLVAQEIIHPWPGFKEFILREHN